MTAVFALWHGGASYAAGYVPALGDCPSDVETFPSLAAAIAACEDRYRSGHWCPSTFTYADGRTVDTFMSCVDETSGMFLWYSDPRDSSDPYPDALIERGRASFRKVPS